MRAILEVRGGPKAVLSPGEKLRVGSRPKADLVVHDDTMSGVHFELSWDGTRCELHDLRSNQGTLLGGEAVKAGEVRNGGWIRAGATDFMVYFEGVTPPPVDFESYLDDAEEDELGPLGARWLRANREPRRQAREALAARAEQALHTLAAADGPRYAVLDAARSDRIRVLLRESVEEVGSLYDGIEGEALAHVAPYLVRFSQGSRLLESLVREGWERRWGIFIDDPHPFKHVRRHLRHFLMVADADTGKKMYFRFYDPVVLRSFIPVCRPKQWAEFFGDIRAFFAEGEAGEVLRFQVDDGPSAPEAPPEPDPSGGEEVA